MEKQADMNMAFERFTALCEKDIRPKLKRNIWLTKESIIKKKTITYFAPIENSRRSRQRTLSVHYGSFVALVEHHLAYDDDHAEKSHQRSWYKLDVLVRHGLYAKYKTAATAE